MKKRLYLDIDGVLNSTKGDKVAKVKFPEEWELTMSANWLPHKNLFHKFWDEEAVASLKLILEETKPEIYIHSTWKRHFELDQFREFFEHWGLDSSLIIDIVPQYKFSSERCHNLSWHIKGERLGEDDTEPCECFVILDDYDMTNIDYEGSPFKKQVVTNEALGLTKEDASKAIEILMR
ncbi:HAD domain-containing protein [bacterium]|nr:HAD domain-containing protein [bacterium]